MATRWGGSVAGGFGVEVVGQEAIQTLLRGYQQPQLDEKLKVGLKAAGSQLRRAVQQAAPSRVKSGVTPGFKKPTNHKAGDLYRSIGAKSLRGTPVAIVVGPVKRHSGMRHLAINPTRPHVITSTGGGIWTGTRWTAVVHHPGNRAHPWVATGVRAGRSRAMDAATRAIFSNVKRDPSWSGWVE